MFSKGLTNNYVKVEVMIGGMIEEMYDAEIAQLRKQLNEADDKIKQLEEQVKGLCDSNSHLRKANSDYGWEESVRRGHK
jgi:DNA mismatch repair ATPase MutS